MSDRIFEISGRGLDTTDAEMRALMNNMANADTPGYKKTNPLVRSFPSYFHDALNARGAAEAPQVMGYAVDQSKGFLKPTKNPLDVALSGEGFFAVEGPSGDILLTRDGRFQLDREGQLRTVSGNYPVLGRSGAIQVVPGAALTIGPNGDVITGSEKIDTLRVIGVDHPESLQPLGGSFFQTAADREVAFADIESPRVLQGYLEASNVEIVDQVMRMVFVNRLYNGNTRVIQTREQMLTRAIDLARQD